MFSLWKDIQIDSGIFVNEALSFFTVCSLVLILSSMLIRRGNRKTHPPRALYHYTLLSRLLAIHESGHIKGGHHGVVFTTGTRGFKNKGTGRSKAFEEEDEASSSARVVFRGKALKLFKKPANSLTSLLSGRALLSEVNDEYITIRRGNLRLLDYKIFGKTLVVTKAEFLSPPLPERVYMTVNGYLLQGMKNFLSCFQCMTILFWVDHFYMLTWFRPNWVALITGLMLMTLMSHALSGRLYLIFRKRVGLH